MDRNQFDTIARVLGDRSTRRKAGGLMLALGIGTSAGLSLLSPAETGAKKKRKKKRCKKLLQPCKPQGKRKCCNDLFCRSNTNAEFQCCKGLGAECSNGEECCGLYLCNAEGRCYFPDIGPIT